MRDFIDARTSIAEFVLPISIVFVMASLFLNTQGGLGAILIATFYGIVLIAGIETYVTIRRMKKYFIKKFGENKLGRGWSFYVISRYLNMRRFRTPKPKVKRGEYPV